jgi:hypothetical protein
MSIALDRFCFTEWLAMPTAHELSLTIGVASCGQSRSNSVLRALSAFCALINSPAYYKGPFGTRSVHQHTGFYLINDHSSGGVWAYPCGNKGEDTLLGILESFYGQTVDRSNFESRIIHCDYDSVLLGGVVQGFITGRKLSLRVSAPYCHHQNGQIERAMQTTLDKTRTLLAASQAPLKY